jgi:hypothetical protein
MQNFKEKKASPHGGHPRWSFYEHDGAGEVVRVDILYTKGSIRTPRGYYAAMKMVTVERHDGHVRFESYMPADTKWVFLLPASRFSKTHLTNLARHFDPTIPDVVQAFHRSPQEAVDMLARKNFPAPTQGL